MEDYLKHVIMNFIGLFSFLFSLGLSPEEEESCLCLYKPENEYADLNIRDLKQRIVNKGLPVKYFQTKEELGQHVFEDWLTIINQLFPPLLQGPEFLGKNHSHTV